MALELDARCYPRFWLRWQILSCLKHNSPMPRAKKSTHSDSLPVQAHSESSINTSSTSLQQNALPKDIIDKWNELVQEERVLLNSTFSDLTTYNHFTRLLCQLLHLLQENGRMLRRVCDSDFPLNVRSSSNTDSQSSADHDKPTMEAILSSWVCCTQRILQHRFAYETYTVWDAVMQLMQQTEWEIFMENDPGLGINYAHSVEQTETSTSTSEARAARQSILSALQTLSTICVQLDQSSLSDTKKMYALIAKSLRAQLLHDLFYALIHSKLTSKYYFQDAFVRMEETSEQLLCLVAAMSMFPLPMTTERIRRNRNEVESDDEI